MNKKNFIIFAGPCQIESLSHSLKIAEHLKEVAANQKNVRLVFKASFDKANRTTLTSKRGVGIARGLEILAEVKRLTELPIVTDIHEAGQAATVAEVADVLQIPAFLCRQTDLLIAAGETGKVINIKKGQFLAPQDMRFAAEKVASTGNNKVLLCERGTCFGYRDLVVDFRSLIEMQELGWPVIMDITHSCMSMGGNEGTSGGSRRFALPYLKAALSIGCQGIFMECHDDPKQAPSDSSTMLPLEGFNTALRFVNRFLEMQAELEIDDEMLGKIKPSLATAVENITSEITSFLS